MAYQIVTKMADVVGNVLPHRPQPHRASLLWRSEYHILTFVS